MKKAITISLAFLLLLLSVRDLVTFAAFKLQQEAIAATLCVNKYEPIPMCLGSCFLIEQIIQDIDHDQPITSRTPRPAEKPVYFSTLTIELPKRPAYRSSDPVFSADNLLSQIVILDLFRPPRKLNC